MKPGAAASNLLAKKGLTPDREGVGSGIALTGHLHPPANPAGDHNREQR